MLARLAKASEGLTAVTTLSERWAIVEAKAAAISTLGVADCLKAQLRRLEPEVCSGAARWPHRLVDSPRAPSRDARAICFKGAATTVGRLRCAEAGDKPSSVRWLRSKRKAAATDQL